MPGLEDKKSSQSYATWESNKKKTGKKKNKIKSRRHSNPFGCPLEPYH